MNREIRQRDQGTLRQGYSRAVRNFEIASIAVWGAVMVSAALRLAPRAAHKPFFVLCGLMVGFVVADFVSGFVHWLADTWGSPDLPVVGNALIRPFREHHVDQTEITRHDFVETNGNNCFISIPGAVLAALLASRSLFASAALFSLTLAVFGTNQFHKWAHMKTPPRLARLLQRAGLILGPEHHAEHHTAPFAKHYCITAGWLNEPLYRMRFFPTLESLITAATGAIPRADDIGLNAALAVAQGPPPPLPELPRLPMPQVRQPPLELE